MFDRLEDLLIRFEEILSELNEPSVINDQGRFQKLMKELYKERIFQFVNDYKVLMIEVENIGYDATGKKIEGSELLEVAIKIKEYIGTL